MWRRVSRKLNAQETFLCVPIAEAVRRGRTRDKTRRPGGAAVRDPGPKGWVPDRVHDNPAGQETSLKVEVILYRKMRQCIRQR